MTWETPDPRLWVRSFSFVVVVRVGGRCLVALGGVQGEVAQELACGGVDEPFGVDAASFPVRKDAEG
jgi:hypothetical protein